MKNIIVASIVALALVLSSFILKTGMENAKKLTPSEAYSVYGYEGVLYRLNNVNGRIDVLVPSNEAALLFPVGQIQLPGANDKLTDDQKKSFSRTSRRSLSISRWSAPVRWESTLKAFPRPNNNRSNIRSAFPRRRPWVRAVSGA